MKNITAMKKNNEEPIQHVDIIGVGIGPFNLSLAALLEKADDLSSLFFDSKPQFDWHPGLLLEDCTLQAPMMADLVTMVNPTSRYSYLNYLHHHDRLYNFYFYEDFMIPRIDYNRYCQWVSKQLNNLQFSKKVSHISEENYRGTSVYKVTVINSETQECEYYYANHIVLGMGSSPNWPSAANTARGHKDITHSADYLSYKSHLQKGQSITVVGSGQSAGEIVLDLLNEQEDHHYDINWLTRSDGFLPMEYSKLGLEHFSPDYIDYFHALKENKRDNLRKQQDLWYKGLSQQTIADIYDRLYKRSLTQQHIPLTMQARSELANVEINGYSMTLNCHHLDQDESFAVVCDRLVLATGHKPAELSCLSSLKKAIKRDHHERPVISRDYVLQFEEASENRIYIQNGEIHTHGIGAPDLGLGAYRSAAIINHITGRKIYSLTNKNVFQHFGIAKKWQQSSTKNPKTALA